MTAHDLTPLLRRLEALGAIHEPAIEDDIVHGATTLEAAGTEVMVTVDPELDDREEVELEALLDGVQRILSITPDRWRALLIAVEEEIDDAVGDEPVTEQMRLSDDLDVRSLVVLPETALLSFAAPRQFPDYWIRVQLDEELELDELQLDPKDAEAD